MVGLFKPRTQVGEEKEKLPLVSWFRLSEKFSVLHMPHLLLTETHFRAVSKILLEANKEKIQRRQGT